MPHKVSSSNYWLARVRRLLAAIVELAAALNEGRTRSRNMCGGQVPDSVVSWCLFTNQWALAATVKHNTATNLTED